MQEVIMPFLYPRINLYLTIVSGGGLFHTQIVNLKTAEKALRSIGFHYNLL